MDFIKGLRERARIYARTKEYIAEWGAADRTPIPGQLDIFGNEVPIGDT